MALFCNYLPSVIIFNIFRYLSPKDRLRASATCRTWRECLFQSSQWPYSRLAVNLCPNSGHTLRRNKHKQNKPLIDSTLALKSFVHKCSRFVHQLVITFDPNSTKSVSDLIEIIDILLSNEDNNNNNFNDQSVNDNQRYNNCRCLRRLTLNPINVIKRLETVDNENNSKTYQLFQRLLQRLEQLIETTEGLEHISFGCLQQLLNHSNRLTDILAKSHSNSLKCLHLSSVKTDPDYYPVLEISLPLWEPFSSLTMVSIDFDLVTDQLLTLMARKQTINAFVINVHGIDEEHEGLSKSSWTQLARSNPNLKVTVNLIHTDDSIEVLRDSLLDTDMPLAHFRAYFVGRFGAIYDPICYLVDLVANRHSKTLLSLTLVNALKAQTLRPNPVFAELQENPLVMLAWRSRHLQSLTIIGYEVCDADLIAITRLRGSQLKHFVFPLSCISLLHSPIPEDEGYYDDFYDRRITYFLDCVPNHIQSKVIEDIAQPLDRKWEPMACEQMPYAVVTGSEELQTTYLSTILSDQTICGECESHSSAN